MIGARGGVGGGKHGIGAQMPRQVERQLHAGRKFRKTLVDAELEVECAVLMPEHDRGRDRRIAGMQCHDFALAGLGERLGGAPDKAGIAFVLPERGAALAFPAAGFERQEDLDRRGDRFRRPRHVETDRAVLGKPVALPAQFLQLLSAERVAQQFVGIAPCVKTGAKMRLQQRADASRPAATLR